jgi:hypothetical protein
MAKSVGLETKVLFQKEEGAALFLSQDVSSLGRGKLRKGAL